MPSPREFWERYGAAYSRFVTFAGATGFKIDANIDRYLLIFWGTSTLVTISPTDSNNPQTAPFSFDTTTRPYELTHALHGTAVNLGFDVRGPVGTVTFRYIEGIMSYGDKTPEKLAKLPKLPRRPAVSVQSNIPEALLEGTIVDEPPIVNPDDRDFPPGWVAWWNDPIDDGAYHRAAASGFGIRFDPVWGRYYLITLADMLRLFPNG